VQRRKKPTFLGDLIPYNPGLRFISEKQTSSKNGPFVLYIDAKNWEDP